MATMMICQLDILSLVIIMFTQTVAVAATIIEETRPFSRARHT